MAWPRIIALRDRARSALGERFTNREFHDVVLGAGIVDDYIARPLAAAKP
jgi:uncharacterized protein (DUF885 family)